MGQARADNVCNLVCTSTAGTYFPDPAVRSIHMRLSTSQAIWNSKGLTSASALSLDALPPPGLKFLDGDGYISASEIRRKTPTTMAALAVSYELTYGLILVFLSSLVLVMLKHLPSSMSNIMTLCSSLSLPSTETSTDRPVTLMVLACLLLTLSTSIFKPP